MNLKEYAISRKIVILMREGYPQRQATAIAYRMWRDGELKPPTPNQRKRKREDRKRRWQRERNKTRGRYND